MSKTKAELEADLLEAEKLIEELKQEQAEASSEKAESESIECGWEWVRYRARDLPGASCYISGANEFGRRGVSLAYLQDGGISFEFLDNASIDYTADNTPILQIHA